MQKTKSFTQYSDNNVRIRFKVCSNSDFKVKSQIDYIQYHKKHQKSEKYKEYKKEYDCQHYLNNRDYYTAKSAKRKDFGYNPLNKRFEGSEGHHIDKINVIHIPKEMHRSIWHSQSKLDTMIKINKLAWEYLRLEQTPTPIYLCPS